MNPRCESFYLFAISLFIKKNKGYIFLVQFNICFFGYCSQYQKKTNKKKLTTKTINFGKMRTRKQLHVKTTTINKQQ